MIERWQGHYATLRPHSAIGYRLPTPEPSCFALAACTTFRSAQPARATTTAGTPT
ncbi:hypothetical protein [Sphingosinicella sp.]|uniref:hypothetical protein n=1 Tax=Sphingosinicella sp. TaxID=1917971 RepID=UPI0035B1DEFB